MSTDLAKSFFDIDELVKINRVGTDDSFKSIE